MPPESGFVCGRLTYDLPLGCLQGSRVFTNAPGKEQLVDLGLLHGLGKQRHLAQLKREELLYFLSFKGVLLQVMHDRP